MLHARALVLLLFAATLVQAAPEVSWGEPREIARSPDGRFVAWAARPVDYSVRPIEHSVAIELRDAKTGQVAKTIQRGLVSANWKNFERAGRVAPILVYFQPGNDCGPGRGHWDGVLDAKFSPDGKLLAVLLENRLRIFEVPSGHRCGSASVRFSSEGGLRYSADGRELHIDAKRRHTTTMIVDGRTGSTIKRKTTD